MKLVDIFNTKSKASATSSQVILLTATISRLLVSLIITIFLGRVLAPSDYGFFALINAIFIVDRGLLDLGTGNVAAKEAILNPSRERDILEGLMGWQRALGIVMALLVFAFALKQDDPYRKYVLCSTAVVLSFMYINAIYPTFQVRQTHGGPAILTVGTQLSLFIGSICLFLLKTVGVLFALLIVIREAVNIAGVKVMATKLLGYRPRPGLRGKNLKIFFGKALTFGLAAMAYNLYFHSGMFLIWLMRNENELGAFAAAFRPIAPLLSLPWILMVPLVPVLAQAIIQDRNLFNKIVKDLLCLSVGIGTIVAVTGIFLAPSLIWFLYGGNYISGELSAINTFRWFSLALCFGNITPVFATALLVVGKERKLLLLSMIGLIFNLVANFLLIPRIGFTSAAMITSMTELFVCLGCLFFIREAIKPIFLNLPILFFVPAIIISLVISVLPCHHFIRLIFGSGMAMLGVLLILVSPSAKRFRHDISSINYMHTI